MFKFQRFHLLKRILTEVILKAQYTYKNRKNIIAYYKIFYLNSRATQYSLVKTLAYLFIIDILNILLFDLYCHIQHSSPPPPSPLARYVHSSAPYFKNDFSERLSENAHLIIYSINQKGGLHRVCFAFIKTFPLNIYIQS